jgi:hypothetical protein
MVSVMEDSNMCAIHAKRVTIMWVGTCSSGDQQSACHCIRSHGVSRHVPPFAAPPLSASC